MNILFATNSFIYSSFGGDWSAERIFDYMIELGGQDATTTYSRIGGGDLQRHWDDDFRINARDELNTGTYDLFVINGIVSTETNFDLNVQRFSDLAEDNGAEMFLLASWPGDWQISLADPNSFAEMDHAGHYTSAAANGTGYIPVPLAYRDLYLALADRYNDQENGALVETLTTADSGHGTDLGNYLTATVLYMSIFGEQVPQDWVPPGIDPIDAALVRDAAWANVQQFGIPVGGSGTTLVNAAPVITSATEFSVVENSDDVGNVTATDANFDSVTYAITGGSDASRFTIDATSGALSFANAPDFEGPSDADGNNVYRLQVTASDGNGGNASAFINVTVTDEPEGPPPNSAPEFVSPFAFSAAENTIEIGNLNAIDADNDTLSYSIIAGADIESFAINPNTGAISFYSAVDFENPSDANGDNVYTARVLVIDNNGGADTATISVTVTDVAENGAPSLTSPSSYTVAENGTSVGTVQAFDPNGDALTYAITGGSDASRFTINATTGALSFTEAPDYETPVDSDGNNAYRVQVTASDGDGGSDSVLITVGVTDALENVAPEITSPSDFSVSENRTDVGNIFADDGNGDDVSYAIIGGADAAQFELDETTGALSFAAAPDFENPVDAGQDNTYRVQVEASDGNGGVDTMFVSVSITDQDENGAPTVTSPTNIQASENGTFVGRVQAFDPNGDAITYGISGGSDASRFTINPDTGVLSFASAPDYEAPTDADGNNAYRVEVTASDGSGASDSVFITVTVTDVFENVAPDIASPNSFVVAENSTNVGVIAATDGNGDALSFAIVGGDDADLFEIDPASGALRFVAAPDFEAPADADGNNTYDVRVSAQDGRGGVATDDVSVTVGDVDEVIPGNVAPVFVSASRFFVAENTTTAGTISATDANGDAITYAVTGGPDAPLFQINPTTGDLSFVAAPDFEAPSDRGENNNYNVRVTANDGNGGFETVVLTISVTDTDEGPVATNVSPVLMSQSNFAVAENTANVGSIVASDADGDDVSYAITGGADAGAFEIDAQSGALRFADAPDFEAPADADGDNIFDVEVTADDGNGGSDSANIFVSVTNVEDTPTGDNAAPVFASADRFFVAENTAQVGTVNATDADGDAVTYSLAGGPDYGLFEIDATTGDLSFIAPPDFEAPSDRGEDNIYNIRVAADDGQGNVETAVLSITVTDAEEGPDYTNFNVILVENYTRGTPRQDLFEFGSNRGDVAASGDEGLDAYRFNGFSDDRVHRIRNIEDGEVLDVSPLLNSNGGDVTDYVRIEDSGANSVLQVNPDGSMDDADFADLVVLYQTAGLDVQALYDAGLLYLGGSGTLPSVPTNEAPVITSQANVSHAENTLGVTTITASDADGDALSFAITGGADADLFLIGANSGRLFFDHEPDFETPLDADGNNIYRVQVAVSDGTDEVRQTLSVSVTDEDDEGMGNQGGTSAPDYSDYNAVAAEGFTAGTSAADLFEFGAIRGDTSEFGGGGTDAFVFTALSDERVHRIRNLEDGEIIDVSALVSYDDGALSDILRTEVVRGHDMLQVDLDGTGGDADFVDLALLYQTTGVDLQAMYDNGLLIV